MEYNEQITKAIGECVKRIDVLEQKLHDQGAKVAYMQVGKRSTMCIIVQTDGWETIGVSYTQGDNILEIGKRWALEDACNKLGQGRFWEGNILNS